MPTKTVFEKYPPFPGDIPVLSIPRLSYAKLLKGDTVESQSLWDASTNHGFFLMDFSDSPGGLHLMSNVTHAFDVSRRFFDLPLEEKKKIPFGSGNTGYKPKGVIKSPDGGEDGVEIYSLPRDDVFNTKTPIPAVYEENRDLVTRILHDLHDVTLTVLAHLTRHLELAPAQLGEQHDLSKPSVSILRNLHYPPQADSAGEQRASLLGHTDNGTLTVLFNAIGGLQVLPSGLADEPQNWAWVRPEADCAVVNIGDSLVQWSGGLLSSGFHRVVAPPGEQAKHDRYSLGYFLKPAEDAPMNRLRGGKVPPLTPDEEMVDAQVGTYKVWHSQKSKGIMKGENKVLGSNRGTKPGISTTVTQNELRAET